MGPPHRRLEATRRRHPPTQRNPSLCPSSGCIACGMGTFSITSVTAPLVQSVGECPSIQLSSVSSVDGRPKGRLHRFASGVARSQSAPGQRELMAALLGEGPGPVVVSGTMPMSGHGKQRSPGSPENEVRE